MESTAAPDPVLPEPMLAGFTKRCRGYDIENRIFDEDFRDLKDAGFLTIPVPRELGGRGLTLVETCREQRRLGSHAPGRCWALPRSI
jgi:alkylation response protein AidB-like acyl-CoA dehydrogenase